MAFVEAMGPRVVVAAIKVPATTTLKQCSQVKTVNMPGPDTIVSANVSKRQIVRKCAVGRPRLIVAVCVRVMARCALGVPIRLRATTMPTPSFQTPKRVCLTRLDQLGARCAARAKWIVLVSAEDLRRMIAVVCVVETVARANAATTRGRATIDLVKGAVTLNFANIP